MASILGPLTNSGFIPLSPEVVFAGVAEVIPQAFTVAESDGSTMSCTFRSRASFFGWGETFAAQVREAEGGSILLVGPVSTHAIKTRRARRMFNGFIEDLNTYLGAQTAT